MSNSLASSECVLDLDPDDFRAAICPLESSPHSSVTFAKERVCLTLDITAPDKRRVGMFRDYSDLTFAIRGLRQARAEDWTFLAHRPGDRVEILLMGEQYDDWGNPIIRSRHEPRDQSLAGTLRHLLTLAVRRHRTPLATVLFALCLLFYWKTAPKRTPRVPPTDWSRFAYVQCGCPKVVVSSSY